MATELTVNLDVTRRNNDDLSDVRAGMHNSLLGLSFIQPPPAATINDSGVKRKVQSVENRRARRLEKQGDCCWRIETIQGLRYRIIADLLCAATLLPGSIAIILISLGFISKPPANQEPHPWLKYFMAAAGGLLLLLYLAWLLTGFCVYRKAMKRKPTELTRCAHHRFNAANNHNHNVNNEPLNSSNESSPDDFGGNELQRIWARNARTAVNTSAAASSTPGVKIVIVPPTAEKPLADAAN